MAAVFKGTSITLERTEFIRDPAGGDATEFTWVGEFNAIMARMTIERNAGALCRTSQNGPVHTLTATYRAIIDGGVEVPVDTWTLTTEVLQKDVFTHPLAIAEEGIWVPRSNYRRLITEAVENGEALVEGFNGSPFAQVLYRTLSAGQTDYEVEYYVLRRNRVVSPNSTSRLNLTTTQWIYNTSALPVPTAVLLDLPNNQTLSAPFGTAWGWRLRGQQSEYIGAKVQQSHEWVLAAWNTGFYAPTGANFPP
jgi:hypothetical protein